MNRSKGNQMVIDYDDPKYRITPVQQAAASCTGALLTSLISKLFVVIRFILLINTYFTRKHDKKVRWIK